MSYTNTAKLSYGILIDRIVGDDLAKTFADDGELSLHFDGICLSVVRLGDDACVADGKLALVVATSTIETGSLCMFSDLVALGSWHDAVIGVVTSGVVAPLDDPRPCWILSAERR